MNSSPNAASNYIFGQEVNPRQLDPLDENNPRSGHGSPLQPNRFRDTSSVSYSMHG